MYNQVKSAFITLTRLPLIKTKDDEFNLSGSLWAFPIVGLVLGGILSAVAYGFISLQMDSLIGSALLVLLMILLTGALHEDGLADCADALGASTPERRLEIMRDSQIGAYGTLALIFSFAIRVYTLSLFWDTNLIYYALIICLMASRGAIVFVPWFSQPARDNGLAAEFKNIKLYQLVTGQILVVVIGYLLIGNAIIYLLVAAVFVGFLSAKYATAKLGGFTGDVLGATEQLAQITGLLILHLLF
ncbi:MAG: adenosylcobinamide-GDP ribazoletransferase [Alphaproteobacteria bacterium]|nr:adenosylcobinamide-GDP ribazoletransferase [Alphaproteobacteria bacterium]